MTFTKNKWFDLDFTLFQSAVRLHKTDTPINIINHLSNFIKFCRFSCHLDVIHYFSCKSALTTSDAISSPDAGGTNEILDGVCLRLGSSPFSKMGFCATSVEYITFCF